MTAQVPDFVDVDGTRYAVAGVSGAGLFDPAAHGVEPRMMHTGCWRGYVCHYAVRDGAFVLAELHLGRGSALAGATIDAGTALLGALPEDGGGAWVYRYDAYVVPFTGTLLAGDGFVRSTYVHMGFHPAWKYERVLELTIDAGRVGAVRDRSAEMAETRARVEADAAADPDGDRSDVGAWVARTFGLGTDRSVPRPPTP